MHGKVFGGNQEWIVTDLQINDTLIVIIEMLSVTSNVGEIHLSRQ
jgi:hypothetical protein